MDRSNTIRMVTCMENGDVRVGNRRGGLFAYDCHLDLLQRNYYHLSVLLSKRMTKGKYGWEPVGMDCV